MAKTTRHNSDSQRGLALVEEDFRDEFEESVPEVPAAQGLRAAQPGPRARTTSRPRREFASLAEEAGVQEDSFLRVNRRVPVRRGPLPSWTRHRWGKILLVGLVLLAMGLTATVVFAIRHFLDHDPRFQIGSGESIQTLGNSELARADLLSVFGSDIGRNIFFVPLAERAAELENIPWIEHATVMRILPNELRVSIVERRPVAFLRVGSSISLIDAEGVILPMTPRLMARHHFDFPVITGMDPSLPLDVRAQRMRLYERFLSALRAEGPQVTRQISEVDLSDPEDVRATFLYGGHALLLHFGCSNFATRYQNYASHIQGWEQQYPNLASIDLRYDDQVVLRMASPPAPSPAQSSGAAGSGQNAKKGTSVKKQAPRRSNHRRAVPHAWRRAR